MQNILQDSVVLNDANLNVSGECCQIVTGPNMDGKSCHIHQVALVCLMAQDLRLELDLSASDISKTARARRHIHTKGSFRQHSAGKKYFLRRIDQWRSSMN